MKIKNPYKFISALVLMILSSSCTKTTFQCGKEASFILIQKDGPCQRTGEDDEDPIIQGLVQDGESNPIANALVELIPQGENSAIDSDTTDSQGNFEVQGPVGWYFIRVTPQGLSPVDTDDFELLDDATMVITI